MGIESHIGLGSGISILVWVGVVVCMVGLHRKAGPTTPKSGPQRYTLGLGLRVRVCVQEHSVITLGTPDSESKTRPNKSGPDFCVKKRLKKV